MIVGDYLLNYITKYTNKQAAVYIIREISSSIKNN